MLFQYVQLRYVLFWDKMISVLAILIFILARAEVMLIIGEAIIIPKRVLDQDKEKKLRQVLSKK